MASLYASRVSRISSRPYMGLHTREYWMIYRGWRPCTPAGSPGSLPDHIWAWTPKSIQWLSRTKLSCGRMIQLLAHLIPPSLVSKLSLFLRLPVCRRSSLIKGGRRVWARSQIKSYDGEKAWPSINHWILASRHTYQSQSLLCPRFLLSS